MCVITFLAFCKGQEITKSPKKGLVIPYWPRHKVGDFEAFNTVSWWYNYHEIKEVQQIKPWWCTEENGSKPENYSTCFPQDSEVKFVPMIYAPEGFGQRPPNYPKFNVSAEFDTILTYNEPDRPDQSNVPALKAAQGIIHKPCGQYIYWVFC